MSELWARIQSAIADLEPRERVLLAVAGGCLVLVLLNFAVLQPILAGGQDGAVRREAAERNLEVMRQLRADYDAIHEPLSAVEAEITGAPGGNIFTTLERLARSAALQIESMEPQTAPGSQHYREEKVRVVLKGVTLSQTTQYLGEIERARPPLSIKSLRIRTKKEAPNLLDVTFTVSSFQPV